MRADVNRTQALAIDRTRSRRLRLKQNTSQSFFYCQTTIQHILGCAPMTTHFRQSAEDRKRTAYTVPLIVHDILDFRPLRKESVEVFSLCLCHIGLFSFVFMTYKPLYLSVNCI